jgi:hypothetical protein
LESNYVIIDGELYHHGVKGMKWGVRRYQNKDGSLTPKGRKRYSDGAFEQWKAKRAEKAKARAKAKAEAAKKKQEQDAKKTDDKVKNAYRKKSASEMTDAELKAAIERAKLEDAYRALRPEEVSKGKQFAQAMNKVTMSVIEDQGKKLLSKLGDKMLEKYFPKEKSALEKLKETAEETKALADIATNKKNKAQADYDITQIGKPKDDLDTQQKKANLERTQLGIKTAKNAADKVESEAREAKAKAEKAEAEAQTAKSNAAKAAADLVSSWSKASASDVSNSSDVSSGKSYVHQLASTPIAGLLPPPKKDDD